tara:strand:+ start:1055 stop:1351 length:297 start_codon:yes stop_codon:yes gene_type:complete
MTKSKSVFNTPLDRNYFKYKDRPKKKDEVEVTVCCNQSVDHEVANVNNEEDWESIQDYIERNLRDYTNTESITPISCKKCGRLIQYLSKLKDDKKHWR